MDPVQVLFLAGLVLFVGLLAEWLFQKTHIPDVLWMVVLGIIMQLTVPGAARNGIDDVAALFITFALLFIVFEGASKIPFNHLKQYFTSSVRMSLLNFVGGFIVGLALGKLGGLSWPVSVILGCIVPVLSGGIIGQIQNYVPTAAGTGTLLAFEAALTDVISVLGVVTMVSFNNFTLSGFLNKILVFLILSAAMGFLLALLWAKLLKTWITTHSYILTIAFILLVWSTTEYVGANGSVAVMAFALTLGNMKRLMRVVKDKVDDKPILHGQAKHFYSELSFMIRSFLFVWMGLIVNFGQPLFLFLGLVICVLLFFVRSYSVRALHGISAKDKLYASVLAPKDITPIVLASLPVQANIAGSKPLLNIAIGLKITSIIKTAENTAAAVHHDLTCRRVRL